MKKELATSVAGPSYVSWCTIQLMVFLYGLVGMLAGVFIIGTDELWLLGALAGAAIGVLLGRLVILERRIQRLEASGRLKQSDDVSTWGQSSTPKSQTASPVEEASPWIEVDPDIHVEAGNTANASMPAEDESHSEYSRPSPGPSILRNWIKKATAWITTGNVPVKVGVIISFFGAGFLLKYAVEHQLLVLPVAFRLAGVAVAGIVLLAIGWRLRNKERIYALSLQGGGVGILFLTTFAALQIWQLLPAPLVFFILVLLTVFTGALAVIQNSIALAILGVVGGFLAPILASDGSGNHVVLFGYYLVLNGAILGIAWFRAWRALNLIGWVFTFLVGTLWGYQYYKPSLFASTEPFLLAHFLFYQLIAILFALRQPPSRIGLVDGTLVFGTPIIAFALQAALVEGMQDALTISAAVVAVFYALTALWLWRTKGDALRLLSESFTALAVVFATITIPLAFDAHWTAASWALEGAALVWIGIRQGHQLPKLAGILLVFLGGLAFIEQGWRWDAGLPLLNGNVLAGLLISLAALFSSRQLEKIDVPAFTTVQKFASSALFVWGLLWWLGTGWMEISDRVEFNDQAGHHERVAVFLLLVSLSAGSAGWLGRARQWVRLRRSSLLLLLLLLPIALAYSFDHGHYLTGYGWLAWPLAFAVQVYTLRVMGEYDDRLAALWHLGTLLLVTALLAIEVAWQIDEFTTTTWAVAFAAGVPGVMALLLWQANKRAVWPVAAQPQTYIGASHFLVAIQVITLTIISIALPGDSWPWPYIPVFNPLDLGMLFALLTTVRSLAIIKQSANETDTVQFISPYKLMLAIAFFVLTTIALVRGVHQFTNVRWDGSALFDSVVVQTALSIYWGLLGFIGMIWGARGSSRPVWLVGAGFMALVVVKLFVVDLGNTGTLERIISFIGIGGLLLVVGYFAPAPPKAG